MSDNWIEEICNEVHTEVLAATAQHGSMRSQHEAYGVILEEVDEFWEEVKINPNKLAAPERQARLARMRKELIQIAAMGIRAVFDLGLKNMNEPSLAVRL